MKNGINKGKGLVLGAESPRMKNCWVPSPPLYGYIIVLIRVNDKLTAKKCLKAL